MTSRDSRLARVTFWLVFAQAIVVIILLAVTLIEVAERTAQNAEISQRLEQLAEENQTLIRINGELSATNGEALERILCILEEC